jgi:biopolymer transport protein ExbD
MSIATEQVMQVNKEVVLPVAKEAKIPEPNSKKSELMLNLTWNELSSTGAIIVDDRHIEASDLQELIRKKKEFNPDLRVVIRADRNAKYQYVRSIMVAMGQAGVPNVTFSAVDKELQKKP